MLCSHCLRNCRAGVYKLASLVQYVPLPVVAGYLGYVGYFCLAAGISLACDVEVIHPNTSACSAPLMSCSCIPECNQEASNRLQVTVGACVGD